MSQMAPRPRPIRRCRDCGGRGAYRPGEPELRRGDFYCSCPFEGKSA